MIVNNLREITSRTTRNEGNLDALNALLVHATSTVEAYKTYKTKTSLSEYPVVNKNILRENIDKHLSIKYDRAKLITTTTSGSTGTPFTIYFNPTKIKRHRAALMYWNERAGATLGKRLFYLRVWNNVNKKGRLSQMIENIIPIEVSHFTKEDCDKLLKSIADYKKEVAILGFSSALSELSKYIEEDNVPRNIKGVLAMSEHLPESVRHDIQKKIGCSVFARYSNMENGFIAQQFDDSGEYLINTADYIVEILKLDSDKPAEEGEMGRIVVTDLYNYAMPFIRYDTGDLGAIRRRDDGKLVLSSVEGRKTDVILDVNGNPVSSHIITNTLWSFNEISQFQFIQKTATEYVFRLNMNGKQFGREAELAKAIKNYLGDSASISFEYVNEIPVLNSGKRRFVINEYKV
ncbi:MAG: hypothetical protein NC453_18820 [Muribaculum sp.]|nr:hypothetical protein [Muribaculum sp.]